MRAPVRYHFLDVLRGLAALWVFVHHLPFRSSYPEKYPQLEAFCRLGHLGVPMFFVISGFCLMASLRSSQRKGERPRSFLYRRFRRIYPPFWCSLVVFLGMPYLLELISSLRTGSFLRPAFPFAEEGMLFWIRIGTLSQIFVPDFPNLPTKFSGINPPNWSLAIEVQFYVVMALCLAFSHRMSKWILVTVALVMPENSMGFPPAIVAGTLMLCIPFYFLCERPFIKPSETRKRLSQTNRTN